MPPADARLFVAATAMERTMSDAAAIAAGLSEARRHIICHSLGLDDRGRGKSYRRHFVTGPGSADYPDCLALVEAGMMVRHDGSPLIGGDDLFLVTPEGKAAVRAELMKDAPGG